MCVLTFSWTFISLVIKENNGDKPPVFKEIYCVINRIGFEMRFAYHCLHKLWKFIQ